ncbi:MAG: DUF4865 family protein, partial [Alphaproteobacteria bacterium]
TGESGGLVHASCLLDRNEKCCAPLYIWQSPEAMSDFLFGEPFARIVTTFGRPRVRTWNVLEFDQPDMTTTATYARREVDTIDANSSLRDIACREGKRHREALDCPGIVAHATTIDADRWEIARFSLWRDDQCAVAANADCVQVYATA